MGFFKVEKYSWAWLLHKNPFPWESANYYRATQGLKCYSRLCLGQQGRGQSSAVNSCHQAAGEIRVGKRKKKINTTNLKAPLATSPYSQRPCKMSPLSPLMPNSWREVQNKAQRVWKVTNLNHKTCLGLCFLSVLQFCSQKVMQVLWNFHGI